MNLIVSFYEGQTADHIGRHIHYIWAQGKSFLEGSHDYIQYLFPNKEPSAINPFAPVLTDETIEEFKSRPDLIASVRRSLEVMMNFYQMDEKYPWWCTKKNHNYLRCTRILHTLKAFGMQEELDNFYSKLVRIRKDNKEVIDNLIFSFWEDAYEGEREYSIVVTVKAAVEAHRTIDVRAASLEEAKQIAIAEVEESVEFVAHRDYQMSMDEEEITEILAYEDA